MSTFKICLKDIKYTNILFISIDTTEDKSSDKSDDPIRMYLREMGGVELLSREGEIAIAKSRLEPHDTGHIHTSISWLQQRVEEVKKENGLNISKQ